MIIREVLEQDAQAITDIYNYYVANTTFTFEEAAISSADIISRIHNVVSDGLPWIVLLENDILVGYAYASRWKERSAYRFSVEATVYLSHTQQGKGLGTQLYTALLARLEEAGINSVIGGITIPNPASIALHEKLGMKQVAHIKDIGYKFDQWLDVGFWQKNLKS